MSSTAVERRGVPAARDVFGLVGFVLLCFGVSILGGMAAASALPDWYASLAKPAWTPPGWVFGPVWTVLYSMIAVAGWLVWREGRSRRAMLLFLLQLALNAAWPWLFFFLRRPDWAFAAVAVLAPAILAAIVASHRVSRGAAWLFVPYLGWVLFAPPEPGRRGGGARDPRSRPSEARLPPGRGPVLPAGRPSCPMPPRTPLLSSSWA
jgi:benzodiazapine receptor